VNSKGWQFEQADEVTYIFQPDYIIFYQSMSGKPSSENRNIHNDVSVLLVFETGRSEP
jgi:hypothetical protein